MIMAYYSGEVAAGVILAHFPVKGNGCKDKASKKTKRFSEVKKKRRQRLTLKARI